MMANKVTELMGPDELLNGKDECSMSPPGTIIPLPDKTRTRQSTLHEFFCINKVAKKHTKKSTTKPMRQLTLYNMFGN